MKQLLLRVSFSLTLLLASQVVVAQSPWSWEYRYGELNVQSCQQVLPLKAGGYLLMGKINSTSSISANLYLVRTDAAGQPLWIQTHTIPDCNNLYILPACENAAGQVLITLRAATENIREAEPTVAGQLLLLQPDGTTAWQKRTATYPLRPAVTGSVPVPYSRAVLDAAGNFLLAQNTPAATTLLRLDATGQQLQQIAFPMPAGMQSLPAFIYELLPLSGRLYAYLSSTAGSRLVELSAQGIQGRVATVPTGATDFLALSNDDILIVTPNGLTRMSLQSNTTTWTKDTYTLQITPQRAVQLPDGKLLVFGTVYQTHFYGLRLRVFDENGQVVLGGPPHPITGLVGALQYSFGSGPKISASGLFLNSTTRELVVGGSLQDTPTQEQAFLLRSAPLAAVFPSVITATSPSLPASTAAWPNPVGQHDQLTISTDFAQNNPLELYDLQGRLVRSWSQPAQASERRLSLQNLPAGLYLLRSASTKGASATLRIVKE
ncbi:T9SS type A sorting domain-containing protein [Hymenobacter sp. 102]|uniref:T9SS type A sorting domain-containing protein n=1 Tax=Hymenobacter sp. 102 TaxID=3403152 RepID=UPI003CF9660F